MNKYIRELFKATHPLHYRDVVVNNYVIPAKNWIGQYCDQFWEMCPSDPHGVEIKLYTRYTDEELKAVIGRDLYGFDGDNKWKYTIPPQE